MGDAGVVVGDVAQREDASAFLGEREASGVFGTESADDDGAFDGHGRSARAEADGTVEGQVVPGDTADDEVVARQGDRVVDRRVDAGEFQTGSHRERAHSERTSRLDAGVELIAGTNDEATGIEGNATGEGVVVVGEGQGTHSCFGNAAAALNDAGEDQAVQGKAGNINSPGGTAQVQRGADGGSESKGVVHGGDGAGGAEDRRDGEGRVGRRSRGGCRDGDGGAGRSARDRCANRDARAGDGLSDGETGGVGNRDRGAAGDGGGIGQGEARASDGGAGDAALVVQGD